MQGLVHVSDAALAELKSRVQVVHDALRSPEHVSCTDFAVAEAILASDKAASAVEHAVTKMRNDADGLRQRVEQIDRVLGAVDRYLSDIL